MKTNHQLVFNYRKLISHLDLFIAVVMDHALMKGKYGENKRNNL